MKISFNVPLPKGRLRHKYISCHFEAEREILVQSEDRDLRFLTFVRNDILPIATQSLYKKGC